MKSIFRFIVLVLLLGGWGLAATAVHVVRHDQGFILLTKAELKWMGVLNDTYADIRAWTMDDVKNHREVIARLRDTGHVELLKHLDPTASVESLSARLTEALKAPVAPPSTRPAI